MGFIFRRRQARPLPYPNGTRSARPLAGNPPPRGKPLPPPRTTAAWHTQHRGRENTRPGPALSRNGPAPLNRRHALAAKRRSTRGQPRSADSRPSGCGPGWRQAHGAAITLITPPRP
jgi:hypothetical protein